MYKKLFLCLGIGLLSNGLQAMGDDPADGLTDWDLADDPPVVVAQEATIGASKTTIVSVPLPRYMRDRDMSDLTAALTARSNSGLQQMQGFAAAASDHPLAPSAPSVQVANSTQTTIASNRLADGAVQRMPAQTISASTQTKRPKKKATDTTKIASAYLDEEDLSFHMEMPAQLLKEAAQQPKQATENDYITPSTVIDDEIKGMKAIDYFAELGISAMNSASELGISAMNSAREGYDSLAKMVAASLADEKPEDKQDKK